VRPLSIAQFAGLALLLLPFSTLAQSPDTFPQKQIGIYLNATNAGDDEFVAGVIDRLPDRGIPALVFDIKGNYVYFDSQSGLANEANLVVSLIDLPALVEKAHSKGIYTIARYIAVRDKFLGRAFPQTRMSHPETGVALDTDWVHPSHETVLEYNRQLIGEIASAGVDEINLDYIRYPTDNLRSLSAMSTGEKIVHLEAFVRMARRAIDMADSDTKLGISTYAILGWYYDSTIQNIGQDIVRFAPFVDVISPMAYPQTFAYGAYFDPALHPRTREYYLVSRTLKGYIEILGEHAWKLRPWIQGYYVDTGDMTEQIAAVYDSGLCGFTVWSASNYYQPLYSSLRALEVPDRCSITEEVAQVIE
jgi:hypothetical protein|tara:strand:- start:22575 stop:23660 length:1086 start_codon:yes stop_codon:yes gene_type:complete